MIRCRRVLQTDDNRRDAEPQELDRYEESSTRASANYVNVISEAYENNILSNPNAPIPIYDNTL